MKDFKNWIKIQESKKTQKTLTVSYDDYYNSLEDLVNYIKTNGNTGHSFSIVVDPDSENEKKFFWDGDGGDHIHDVSVSKDQNETMTSTGCVASFARPTIPTRRRDWMPMMDELDDGKKKKKKKVYEQPQVKE